MEARDVPSRVQPSREREDLRVGVHQAGLGNRRHAGARADPGPRLLRGCQLRDGQVHGGLQLARGPCYGQAVAAGAVLRHPRAAGLAFAGGAQGNVLWQRHEGVRHGQAGGQLILMLAPALDVSL